MSFDSVLGTMRMSSVPRTSIMLWSVVLLASMAFGCRQGAVIEPPDMKAPVRLGEVTVRTMEATVKVTGTLKASKQAILITESKGRLIMGRNAAGKRLIEGDEVEAGELIAKLRNPALVATTALDARKEEVDNARKALDRALRQVSEGIVSDSELEPLRSTMTNAKYALDGAIAELDKLNIRAPMAGRIVKLAEIVDGDHVASGTEIATIMSYRIILAEVNIANSDFPLVAVDQEARVTNFAFKDQTFHGYVAMISPVADDQTRAFKAEIRIDNLDEALRPGMYIQAHIVVARHEEAIVVPPELVITRNNRPVVFVVEDEKALEREVEIGIETRDGVEVIRGLARDDALIVEGFETLRDGTPVRISQ